MMETRQEEFVEVYGVEDNTSNVWAGVFAGLKGKYTLSEFTKDAVDRVVSRVTDAISLTIGKKDTKHVMAVTVYEVEGKATSIQISIRPNVHNELKYAGFKYTRSVAVHEGMADDFIDEVATWYDRYEVAARIDHNIGELNKKLEKAVELAGVPYSVQVGLGDNPVEVTDKLVVFGYTEDQVFELKELALFDTTFISRSESQLGKLVDALKEIPSPVLVSQSKAQILKQLGFKTRKSAVSFAKATTKRGVESIRTGRGYVLTDKYFAIVEKTAVTDAEAKDLKTSTSITLPNSKMTTQEKAAGKTTLFVDWLLSPVDVEMATPVDGVKLSDIVK